MSQSFPWVHCFVPLYLTCAKLICTCFVIWSFWVSLLPGIHQWERTPHRNASSRPSDCPWIRINICFPASHSRPLTCYRRDEAWQSSWGRGRLRRRWSGLVTLLTTSTWEEGLQNVSSSSQPGRTLQCNWCRGCFSLTPFEILLFYRPLHIFITGSCMFHDFCPCETKVDNLRPSQPKSMNQTQEIDEHAFKWTSWDRLKR